MGGSILVGNIYIFNKIKKKVNFINNIENFTENKKKKTFNVIISMYKYKWTYRSHNFLKYLYLRKKKNF